MADEEQNLLLEDGEGENGGVDEGLIIQLSKRDSTSVTNRQTRRRRSTEHGAVRMRDGNQQPITRASCGVKATCVLGTLLAMFVFLAIGLSVGLFVGHSIGKGSSEGPEPSPPAPSNLSRQYNWGDKAKVNGKEVNAVDWVDGIMKAENIKNYLKHLTASPHIAGSEENHMLAQYVYNEWMGYNFDNVNLVNYSVLLSYPNTSNPNVLQLKQGSEVIYTANIDQEPPLTPGENDSRVAPPFNAYSGSGSASGPLVYVNYGRIEDFFYLTRNLSLDLSNHICIARYGAIYRGDKAKLAQRFNCSGLLIYSDPADYAPPGVPVYPNGPSLPLYGVQRGSLINQDGDPMTPGVPAIDGFYRVPYSQFMENEGAPSIPVQPISYGDALHFFSQLEDHDVPSSDWVGGLNITYKIAQPASNTNYTMLEVNNYQERRTIYNVIANIYGAVEPDRFVILGNHRDAWVFGGVDPNSGTAALMELARTLSLLRGNDGWRPGRTIVLCSWDAEEYGLIGSTEFVEDKGKLLREGTVAYLNVDSAVAGSEFLSTQANPLIYQPFWAATQMVKAPNTSFSTVYDQWLSVYSKDYNGTTKPEIMNLGSGSDYAPFLQLQGITCSSMAFANRTLYAVYHSVHDNFYWMSEFGDPSFTHHLATGLVWIKLALILSTEPVLPFDPRDYAIVIGEIFQNLKDSSGDILEAQGISLSYLEKAISDFTEASINLYHNIQLTKSKTDVKSDENIVRIINNQLMNIERAFLHDEGLPGRSYFKHVIFAPSSVNSYDSSVFPGVSDTIFDAVNYGGSWNDVRRQLDFVRNHVRYATSIMAEPSLKYAPIVHVPIH